MGKLARITWPQEYSELQRIEELLLCGICYDYMDTSVMTPCSHNYCSLCIRKYLHYKTQCPACFEKTFEKDLHTNRILDELVCYFGKIREKLAYCIAGAKIIANEDNEIIEESTRCTPVRPARTNQSPRKPTPKIETKHNEIIANNTLREEKVAPFVLEQPKTMSSPSTSGVCKVAGIFTPKSRKNSANPARGKTVPCPVCGVDVSEFHINKHLDDCLRRETSTQQPVRIEPKRKPLPKLVFSLMKDAELRKKMKDLGLPSQGDRKTLEARFHRYSTLYNAECDKKEPRAVEELLRQCENEENLEKKMLKFAQAADRLKITRNSEQSIIEQAQKQYLETNRQNYHVLIDAIKERDKTRKPPVRRSLIERDVCEASESQISRINVGHVTELEDDPANYSMNAYEATFQDSDSNSSCPLQRYASDDPMNFLSFKMTTTDESPEKSPSKLAILDHQRANDARLDAPVSPVKNTTLRDIKSDISPNIFPRETTEDVYCATTENETSDEDVVPPSPVAATSNFRKRAKFSLRQKTQSTDNSTELGYNHAEGQKLALSIARDFTFDTSSNDSVGSEIVNEIVDKRTTDKSNVEGHKIERVDISNLDKENHGSSATTCSSSVVNRPIRKRNCVARSENVIETVDSASSTEKTTTTTTVSHDESPTREDETSSRISHSDGPLKRRRRRKANETETINPPRRPLRKRLVNPQVTANLL